MFNRSPQIVEKRRVPLDSVLMELLPPQGSVEVQRDAPGHRHEPHTHPVDELICVVDGVITFRAGKELTCTPGDRLLLPAGTVHESVAGSTGCVYVIRVADHEGRLS